MAIYPIFRQTPMYFLYRTAMTICLATTHRQELARLPTMGMVRFLSSATRLGLVDEARCGGHGMLNGHTKIDEP